MFLIMQSSLVVWLYLIGLFGRMVSGQCAINYPFLVSNAVCAVDPIGDTSVEFQALPNFGGCGAGNPQASFTASMTYTNTLGAVTALAAPLTITTTIGINSVLTFDFPVPFSSIQDGSRVTQNLIAQAPQVVIFAGLVYTQTHSQSIFFVETTSTLTATTDTEITSFVTTTDTDTQTLPGPTVTVTTVTGVNTITAPRPTITKTITFTPRPKTIRRLSVKVITTTLSCIRRDQDKDDHRRGRSPHGEFIAARQAAITYENVNCGAITPTTVVTATSLVTTTVTTTDTITSTVPTVVTTTVVAPPVTSFLSVVGSTTVTPAPRVKTRFTVASRVTVTSTKVITLTRVVVPTHPVPPCTRPPRKPLNAPGRPTLYRPG